MPRRSAQNKIQHERFVILINGDTSEPRYLTNTGKWVRIASIARRFLSKDAADRAAQRFTFPVEVRPEQVD